MRYSLAIIAFLILSIRLSAQETKFNKSDSLRGSLNKFRDNYDVYYYKLDLKITPEKKYIQGYNQIFIQALKPLRRIQLDLFENLAIDSVTFQGSSLPINRYKNAFWIDFPFTIQNNTRIDFKVYYQGSPVEADNPPWDGGFVWEKDSLGYDWVGVACQGLGASVWWPNKDHLSDEPDSMTLIYTVPDHLLCAANGQLVDHYAEKENFHTYHWHVSYPINNYNVTLNIGNYVYFSDQYQNGNNKPLDLNFYVLSYNKSKAKTHFKQINGMLEAYEHYFGPFPFWRDGYKLVETPYWGMEHQTAIAYGNDYQNNPFGFDFIIIHESGHEYWGNSVSAWDNGELWIHEAFTTYTEALYVEYWHGEQEAIDYLLTQKELIKNKQAILQPTGVNFNDWHDADMYYKGSWMLHTIRNIIHNDQKWFRLLKSMYRKYELSIVTSKDIIRYLNSRTSVNLSPVFEQYLNYTAPPILEYRIVSEKNRMYLQYRWKCDAQNFKMPIRIRIDGESRQLKPSSSKWRRIRIEENAEINWQTDYFYYIPVQNS